MRSDRFTGENRRIEGLSPFAWIPIRRDPIFPFGLIPSEVFTPIIDSTNDTPVAIIAS